MTPVTHLTFLTPEGENAMTRRRWRYPTLACYVLPGLLGGICGALLFHIGGVDFPLTVGIALALSGPFGTWMARQEVAL